METQYILIRKNKSEAKTVRIQSEVKTLLKDASFRVMNDFIYFSEDNKENFLIYRMSYEDNNVLYLNVETSLSDSKAAKLLDEFDKRLIKGYHRRKFYIINAYSDASYWFCSKLMPKLGTFERLLRKFIYLTVTKVYGSEWVKNLNSELIKHLKKISDGVISEGDSLIEQALEWLDFKEIEDVLFTPRVFDIDEDVIINEILSDDSLSRDEIISKVRLIEKKSLWDRDFREFSDIEDLPEKFDVVRKIRNTVMHNKTINSQYYEDSILKIQAVNHQLKIAIEKIETEIYDKPKNRKTIVYDGRAFVEAVFKSIQRDEDIAKRSELGRKLLEKHNELFAQVKVSDLLETKVAKNDMVLKKLGNE